MIFTFIFCCFLFTACDKSENESLKDFIADEQHCVVCLPREYDIFYENNEQTDLSIFDKDLYNAETVNGKQKKDGFRYYNLLKNEPFRILTPLGIIQDKNANLQTLVYWKLNDTLCKDGDNYQSANVFTCAKDTEISPVYYDFRAVGMILYSMGESEMPAPLDDEVFDENGDIKERDGVHYLYGSYDFQPDQKFWNTNLTINKYLINHTVKSDNENNSEDFYTINVEFDKGNIFDKGKIIIKTLYKIDEHGYMTYGSTHVINNDELINAIRTLPIGKHEIKYSFI